VNEAISLADAVTQGIVPTSLAAVRKASQRPGFPEPVGLRGAAHLYSSSDLRAWADTKGVLIFASGAPDEEWKTWPGFSSYQASHRGYVRSVDRIGRDQRPRKGTLLKARPGGNGYPKVDLTRDDGVVVTLEVHVCVLTAHAGPCPPGKQGSHLNDNPLDNRWPENLAWEDKPTNERRKFDPERAAGPIAKPVPPRHPKHCVRCGHEFSGNGKRCHSCVVTIGQGSALMLRGGAKLEDVAAHYEYPSLEGIHALAVKYGGYGQPWSRRVAATLRDKLPGRRGRRSR